MLSDKIKKDFVKCVAEIINEFSYTDIDIFCDDRELSEKKINELLALNLTVSIEEKQHETTKIK